MNNSKRFLIPLLILVVLLIVGGGLYIHSKNKSGNDQSSGKISVLFKKDASLSTIESQFSSIGLTIPESAFESQQTLVATPHRNQGKLYGDLLSKDPLVKIIDYTNTDENLAQYHEKIKNDTAYLYINFIRPMKSDDIVKWLKEKYPDLVDVSIQDKSKNLTPTSNGLITVVNTQTGQESYGGVNPWTQTLQQSVSVAKGKETEYLQKILSLSTVESAAIVRIVQNPPCKDISCAGLNRFYDSPSRLK